MDKETRELVEKELAGLKAKMVLNEAQLLALQTLTIPGENAGKLNQQIQATKTQIEFDKAYAKNIEEILKEDK